MNILVTGATGFIGSHLCRALLEEDHEVFGLSRSREDGRLASLTSHDCFHVVSGDVRSLPAIQSIIEQNNVDAVIHLAAYATYGITEADQNPAYLENNVAGTLSILQASLLSKCSRVIYSSTRDVYGVPRYLPLDESHPTKPLNFYGLTKLQGESYCDFYARNYGLHCMVLRYAGVYGPGKNKGAICNFIRAALENQPLKISSDANQTRDFVYVKDVVSATVKALDIVSEVGFDTLNIGSGRETSLNELAAKIIGLTGASIDFACAPGDSDDRFVLDITRAQRVLGYKPRSIDDALSEFIHFLDQEASCGDSIDEAVLQGRGYSRNLR